MDNKYKWAVYWKFLSMDKYHDWHRWFAWKPIVIEETENSVKGLVWLTNINRRLVLTDNYEIIWEYKSEHLDKSKRIS